MDYRYGSHTVYKIEYHLVWVTKYRYKAMVGDVGQELVRQTCEAFEIQDKEVASKDHVYGFSTAEARDMMRHIKGRSSSKLFEEFPELKKRYWGRHFWARGYFCVTVGDMTEDMIKEYLDHHFKRIQRVIRVEPIRRVVEATRTWTFSPLLQPTGFQPVVVEFGRCIRPKSR